MTGRVLFAALHLLDHQLVDRDGVMIGKVDDLEVTVTPEGDATVEALLSGPGVLATRLGHRTYGQWRERMERALEGPTGRTARIPLRDVRRLGPTIELALPAPRLATFGTEQWVGDHVIGRIPGGRLLRVEGTVPEHVAGSAGDDAGRHDDEDPDDGAHEDAAERFGWKPTGGGQRLRMSSLLRREVVDDRRDHLGHVLDVRLVQDGPVRSGFDAAIRVDGLVIGHGRAAQRVGLLRHEVHGPWILRQLARAASPRRSFALCDDVDWAAVLRPDEPIVVHATGPVPER